MKPQQDGLPNGIALYAKIASVLRTQISSGHLPLGQQLPSIERLSADYKVAPVTVRQAVRLLVEEGLLSSQRGRGTFVTGGTLDRQRPDSHVALDTPAIDVKLLEDLPGQPLPDDLGAGHQRLPHYRWIRKLHYHRQRMFFVMNAFIGEELEQALPTPLPEGLMIMETFAEAFLRRRVEVVTTVNVSSADILTADLLKCDLSFPVAQITRLFLGPEGIILLATKAIYRADVFRMRTSQTAAEFLASRASSSVHPQSADGADGSVAEPG